MQLPICSSNGNLSITLERWVAIASDITGMFDIISDDGGITAERVPLERDAKLMALAPQLVVHVCQSDPRGELAQRIRSIVSEREWNQLAGDR